MNRPTKMVKHPNSIVNRLYPVEAVLQDLAAQEGCDGEPYDEMQEASTYITELNDYIDHLEKEIRKKDLKSKKLLL